MGQQAKILLIEDNDGDVLLIKEALQEARIECVMEIAKDGSEAIKLLTERAQNNKINLPDLILLDINLPKQNGHEVLAKIKKNPSLKRIPVIVLSTSSYDSDIEKAYDLHANCYIVKPLEVNSFLQMVESFKTFWLATVKLPKQMHYEEG
ncbi:response regulator [Algoriphagus pacificus]|uniref:Response regulator n=1 Tax=Algoriphagus pacificus TaxID=2811234 RepID=A0ABS3CPA7_9BACT|nr:response regulator [Algoriphagus pacificus]MBN7818095.1 response regulator [Algoriphagus pacificus]